MNEERNREADAVRVMWARHWAPQGSAIEAMLRLRADLLRRAEATGLRTALLYSAGWQVEWVEGREPAAEAEWTRARAAGAWLLHRSHGPRVLADPVQVASLHAGEKPTDVARRLHQLARECEQGWDAEPWEVWQALSAPCRWGRVLPEVAVARRDVLALASDDNAAVDLLRLLAQASQAGVAYQRYAGSDLARGDVGAAYVDAPSGTSGVTRVQALSRRALAHGVTILGLRNVVRMVVLLGRDAHRGQALLEEVRRLLQRLARPVEVHLVSHLGALLAQSAQLLAEVPGIRVHPVHAMPGGHAALAVVTDLLAAGPAAATAPAEHREGDVIAAVARR
jgi:hypothetical protein